MGNVRRSNPVAAAVCWSKPHYGRNFGWWRGTMQQVNDTHMQFAEVIMRPCVLTHFRQPRRQTCHTCKFFQAHTQICTSATSSRAQNKRNQTYCSNPCIAAREDPQTQPMPGGSKLPMKTRQSRHNKTHAPGGQVACRVSAGVVVLWQRLLRSYTHPRSKTLGCKVQPVNEWPAARTEAVETFPSMCPRAEVNTLRAQHSCM